MGIKNINFAKLNPFKTKQPAPPPAPHVTLQRLAEATAPALPPIKVAVAPAKAEPSRLLQGLKRATPYVLVGGLIAGGVAAAAYFTANLWTAPVLGALMTAGTFLTTNPIGWGILAGAALLVLGVSAYVIYRSVQNKRAKAAEAKKIGDARAAGEKSGQAKAHAKIFSMIPKEQPVLA